MTAERHIVLTGATGVLGSALLKQLRATPVTCLIHRAVPDDLSEAHSSTRGDLTERRLGQSPSAYADLARRANVIVHAAATTDFTDEPAAIRALNVEGTERILEFAATAQAPLVYVSTAFVDRLEKALFTSMENRSSLGRNAYLESKRASEQLVTASGIPHAIVRPSVVIGDSATAEMTRTQGLHMMLKAFCEGVLPFVPMAAQSRIDFVPQDFVAAAIAGLALAPPERLPAETLWITAGCEAVTVEQMVEICLEAMAARGMSAPSPRYFDQETLDRLIVPAFLETLPEKLQQRMLGFLALTTLFSTATPFPDPEPRLLGGLPAPRRQTLRHQLRRGVERYCVPETAAETVEAPA
jgi:thioester reductase-like protein